MLKSSWLCFLDTLYILLVEIGRGIDCPLIRLVSELICYMSSEMLNTVHSLALIRSIISAARCYASAAYAVRPSVTFVDCVETNKHRPIFQIVEPSDSLAILIFARQTSWQYSDGNPLNGCISGVFA